MEDIPDSTDWLNTPLTGLADLENALHCQICKEFYDTPMITSCQHTFCSKCIRSSLSADGQCPACRAKDQSSKLRNNWALQEVVTTFLAARPRTLEVARQEREQEQAVASRRASKRKRAVLDSDDVIEVESEGRNTRQKSRRLAASQSSQQEANTIDDTDEDGTYEPEKPQQNDGLVECPLGCGNRMKIEAVDPHLDRCEDEQKAKSRPKSRTPVPTFATTKSSPRHTARPQERISELSYSMMNDMALRKKLKEVGIPNTGNKQLMTRRHTEWVNIWNANCDSSNPRPKRDLLRDLDAWERTQGGRAPMSQANSSVMRKDFDGAGWATANRDDFSRLIADAQRKKAHPQTSPNPAGAAKMEVDTTGGNMDEARTSDDAVPQFTEPREVHAPDSLPKGREDHPPGLNTDMDPMSNCSLKSTKEQGADKIGAEQGTQASSPLTLRQDVPTFDQKGSTDQHFSPEDRKAPCDLPAHLTHSPDIKKVPMFELPSASSRDLDGNAGG